MTTQIKITQLVDIGANLATTTLLPVINMTGVLTTQKTNLGNVGNVILAGAGTTYQNAALANLAYSVTNAAQPNITSVGTLTSLSVTGNATINGNLMISTEIIANGIIQSGTGFSTGGYLSVNGTTDLHDTTVTGNLLATGNVTANAFIGDGSQLTNIPSAGTSGEVQINWQGSFSNQGGTPDDTYSTLQFDSNGMPTLNGTNAYQQRVNNSPYMQIFAPRVESTDFDIASGPGLTVVGYDDTYNTPRSAYMSLQDQANATQQWDFGILGNGNNNFVVSDRTNSNEWQFGTDGTFTLPQGTTISEALEIITVTLDQFTDAGYPGTQVFNKVSNTRYEVSPTGPYMELISGIWRLKLSTATYYDSTDLITWGTVAGGLPTPIGTLTTLATMSLGVGGNVWNFAEGGTLTAPGNISAAGNVTVGGNLTATGNLSANNFSGNGGGLSNVATKITSSWTLASGVNTVNISVPLNGTYTLWINGNIPNGIVTYTATAVVTNTNVPVLGEQYAWYYALGNALVFTSIPNQFTGTVGSISNVNIYSGNTANVFTFGITNNSGSSQIVNYGYTKL